MSDKSLLSIRHWDFARLALVASAFFAMAALGFFLAVWIQLHGPLQSGLGTQQGQLTDEQKYRILEALNATSTTTSQNSALPVPPSSQADPGDPKAAMKLKILESLNKQ